MSTSRLEFISDLSDEELISCYPKLLKELRAREIIRTKNLIGDLAEYIVLSIYKKNANLPNLAMAPTGTKNIDAISVKGERYAIKSTSGSSTGVFSSISMDDNAVSPKFEYLVIVCFDRDYEVREILECDWNCFLRFRGIKEPEGKWYVYLSNEFVKECRKIPNKTLNP